jgi:NAD(P)-dependent dehydrogenase (short-subunit alcohol dehydrogenase family)
MTQIMREKTCLVTGATSGIGKATAHALARQGAKLVVVGRNLPKTEAAVQEIRQQSGNPDVAFLLADLSSQAQIRQLAGEFRARYDRLDVLVNNAGAVFARRQESVDGLELTFATNHLNYFLLTNLLLDRLRASAPARIVNVASAAHQGVALDFDDLQMRRRYGMMLAYGRSKLANLYFTYELARRLAGSGVTVNTVHPGYVATGLGANNFGFLGRLLKPLINLPGKAPGDGADTVIYLATSPGVEGVSGEYFVDRRPVPSSQVSYDEDAARRLWQISEELTGLRGRVSDTAGEALSWPYD